MTTLAPPNFQWVYCWSKGCTHKLFMVSKSPTQCGVVSIKCKCGSTNLVDLQHYAAIG